MAEPKAPKKRKTPEWVQRNRMKTAIKRGRKIIKREKEGGGSLEVTRDVVRRTVASPKALKYSSRLAILSSAWMGMGAPPMRSQAAKDFMKAAAPGVLIAGGALAEAASAAKAKDNVFSGHIDAKSLVLDKDGPRKEEYTLVKEFSRNPKAMLRRYGGDPIKLSRFYGFLHSMRRIPPTSMSGSSVYRIGQHEGGRFYQLATHAMLYRLGQLPLGAKEKKVEIRKQLAEHGIKLMPDMKKQISKDEYPPDYPTPLRRLVPKVVEDSRPDNVDDAISTALFESAIAMSKLPTTRQKIKIPLVADRRVKDQRKSPQSSSKSSRS